MRPTTRTSRIRPAFPPVEYQPPWDLLEHADAEANAIGPHGTQRCHRCEKWIYSYPCQYCGHEHPLAHAKVDAAANVGVDHLAASRPQPVIAHLGAAQIAQQLVELIHDEAAALDTDGRRLVAHRVMAAVAPWLRAGRR